ncbi:Ger(x)C family spore germination C-terminal domain-containing protein [Metabacillus malikii]|uniref:Ger(x)C family spore germination C-terminal domain-containing protein n=1 Tax=Metabacillus malikii TaxID=1504265 RepID=UPI0027D80311|nr:Ger(x)C family spore germination C-terminal domain-containing protein [Metabacillus malikii]
MINYSLEFDGVIEEAKQKVKQEEISEYAKIAEEVSAKRLKSLLNKLRDNNLDPFGFGLRYRARSFDNDHEYKKWSNMYQDVEFTVNVKTTIRSTGVIE